MDVYASRQPIFTPERTLFGYELLYDSPQSHAEVLSGSLLSVGWEHFAEGRKVCVPFNREMLLSGMESIFPPDRLVLGLGADTYPDSDVTAACERLIDEGYEIGVDESVHGFLPYAQYVAVDLDQCRGYMTPRRLKDSGRTIIARQVTTQDRFEFALDAGYDLFQGFFFAQPAKVRGRRIPMAKLACTQLLAELQYPELNFDKLREIISEEVSLPYQLLKYANSGLFHFRTEIASIEHALSLLGERHIRHWIALAALPALAQHKQPELVVLSLIRGRFCERLAEAVGADVPRAFLIGLFSLLDALLETPLADVLAEANLSESIQSVLLDRALETDPVADVYHLVRAYERAKWAEARAAAAKLKLSGPVVAEAYAESMLATYRGIHATLRKSNTRRQVRHELNAAVRILWTSDSGEECFGPARLVNVSVQGMQLQVGARIPVRTTVTCNEMSLGISARGSVRYCNFAKGKYLIGVECSGGTGWKDPLQPKRT